MTIEVFLVYSAEIINWEMCATTTADIEFINLDDNYIF